MTLADLFNAPTEITFEGRAYQLRQPDQLERGMFQRWMESRARGAIARAIEAGELDEARARKLDQDTNDAIAAGAYEWDGELCVKALQTPAGVAKILQIVLRDQGVTDALARRMVERQQRELAAVMVSRVTQDPNALRAVLATLGLPENFFSSPSATPHSEAPPTSPPSPDSPTTNSSSSSTSSETPSPGDPS